MAAILSVGIGHFGASIDILSADIQAPQLVRHERFTPFI